MKLVCYDAGKGPRAGVLDGAAVIDISELVGEARPLQDVRALLEWSPEAVARVEQRLQTHGRSAPRSELARVRLRPPVLQPPTVRDFFDYEGHASGGGTRELADVWYRLPIFYFSNPLRMFGPEDEVPYPSATRLLDYELELGCVIAREGSNLSEADGLSHIAGFTIFNDWSCRDLQRDEMASRLGPAKGKDSATSIGPCVVTRDELAPYLREGRLHVRCTLRVNGELWMDGDGGQMQHTWGMFVERASRDSRVVPGDVFGSGTVSGGSIGEAIRNGFKARYLQPGDQVEIEVEGLGVLRNRVVAPVADSSGYRFMARGDGS